MLIALEFHWRLLTIHGFVVGNGRTGRILSNLILVSCGYPPFGLSDGSEKEACNRYLSDIQGHGGDPGTLYSFLSDLVARSMKIVLDAANGEEIEGLDDCKKELNIFKNNLKPENELKFAKSQEVLQGIYESEIWAVLMTLVQDLKAFEDLFIRKELTLLLDGSGRTAHTDSQFESLPIYS